MSVKLNILWVVSVNIQCIWNYAKFDSNAWILANFLLKQTVVITAVFISTQKLVQTKFTTGISRLDNYIPIKDDTVAENWAKN